jgi:hypothetical protein
VLNFWAKKKLGGTTFGESEKALYPAAMFAFLTGQRNAGVKALQEEDNQAKTDHAHTHGIDLYWCFTLKAQVRKYFYFGRWLDPAYRERMREAAQIRTEQDPLRQPHPVYGKGDPSKGVWGPENKGSWVDVRYTDNLRAMRDTSAYLFAEETGNEATRQLYQQRIAEYVQTLHHIGMSEWDSPNYHSHALSNPRIPWPTEGKCLSCRSASVISRFVLGIIRATADPQQFRQLFAKRHAVHLRLAREHRGFVSKPREQVL